VEVLNQPQGANCCSSSLNHFRARSCCRETCCNSERRLDKRLNLVTLAAGPGVSQRDYQMIDGYLVGWRVLQRKPALFNGHVYLCRSNHTAVKTRPDVSEGSQSAIPALAAERRRIDAAAYLPATLKDRGRRGRADSGLADDCNQPDQHQQPIRNSNSDHQHDRGRRTKQVAGDLQGGPQGRPANPTCARSISLWQPEAVGTNSDFPPQSINLGLC